MTPEPGFEHSTIKGITIKNMIVTIICTATLVSGGMGAYFGIQASITKLQDNQESQNKIMDLRIRALEDQQKLINIEVREIQGRVK